MQTIDYLFVISLLFGGQLVTSTALHLVQRCIEMRFGLHMREVTLYWAISELVTRKLRQNYIYWGDVQKICTRNADTYVQGLFAGHQRYALESQVRTMFYSIFVKCDTYSQCEFGIYFANSCWYFLYSYGDLSDISDMSCGQDPKLVMENMLLYYRNTWA